jgi:hypothetical protein
MIVMSATFPLATHMAILPFTTFQMAKVTLWDAMAY